MTAITRLPYHLKRERIYQEYPFFFGVLGHAAAIGRLAEVYGVQTDTVMKILTQQKGAA